MGSPLVPTQCRTPEFQRATALDYSPATHPRPLNPGADAQRVLDGVVGSNQGIAERAKFDGGFRMNAPGKPLEGNAVADALACTANYYADRGDSQTAGQIARSQVTYANAVKGYWASHPGATPADPVR